MVKNISQVEHQNVINLIFSKQEYNIKPREFSLRLEPFAWLDIRGVGEILTWYY